MGSLLALWIWLSCIHRDLWVCGMIRKFTPAQMSKDCHVSILDQNQNMINLLRLDVFLTAAKILKDFIKISLMLSVKWPVFGAQSQLCFWHSRVGAILRRPQCLWHVHHTPLYSSFHRAEEWLHYSPTNTYTFTEIHPLLTWSHWNLPLSEIPPFCEGGNKTEQNESLNN